VRAQAWRSSGAATAFLSSRSSTSSTSLRCSFSFFPSPPPPLVWRRRKGKGHGRLGFQAAASRGSYGAALGFAARARTMRAVMPGVRATATRRASGDCRCGPRVCSAGGQGAGEKGGRARAITLGCRGAGRRASWLVTRVSGGCGGRERGKGRGAAVTASCRGSGRAAEGSERSRGGG
jgi:hypothetical protein